MPDIQSNKAVATTYPPQELYQKWTVEASERDMTISQYIIRMVESGRKQISLENYADSSIQELRQQRSDLKKEVQHYRNRANRLERQLHHSSLVEILEFIEDNPGAETPEIIQHVLDTVPSRVASNLDLLEGNGLKKYNSGYRIKDNQNEDLLSGVLPQEQRRGSEEEG